MAAKKAARGKTKNYRQQLTSYYLADNVERQLHRDVSAWQALAAAINRLNTQEDPDLHIILGISKSREKLLLRGSVFNFTYADLIKMTARVILHNIALKEAAYNGT